MARTSKKRAAGGSVFKGVFIGLLFGLIIAATVAFYVNRAPVPFVDRVGRHVSPQDRATAEVPDPNRALYGGAASSGLPGLAQTPVPEASPAPGADPLGEFLAKAELAPAAPTPAPRIGTQSPTVGVTPSVGVSPPAVQASQPGQRAVAPASPAASASGGQQAYVLQAGAFRGQAEAEALRAKLAMMGYEARVESTQVGSGTLHRVRLGPYAHLDDTNRNRSNLAEQGIETAIIRR